MMLDDEEEEAVDSTPLQMSDPPLAEPDSPPPPDAHAFSPTEHIAAVPDVGEPGEDLESEDEPSLFTDTQGTEHIQ